MPVTEPSETKWRCPACNQLNVGQDKPCENDACDYGSIWQRSPEENWKCAEPDCDATHAMLCLGCMQHLCYRCAREHARPLLSTYACATKD